MIPADHAASTAQKRAAFRTLHEAGCFVIPNPWDRGTALYLESLGFKALATTSAGYAFGQGLPDASAALGRDAVLAHIREIVAATGLPVNADYEAGYADDLDALAESVRLCAATGVAGLSIEDATGDAARPLYDVQLAAERIAAAKQALASAAPDVLLTARAECFLVKHPDPLREAIRRLVAYAEAGADVLYAPGLTTRDEIRAVLDAVAPKPVNVLISGPSPLSVADLADLGVRRISLGSALARAAWGGVMRAAQLIAGEGRFDRLDGAVPFAEINAFFRSRVAGPHPDDTGKG